MAQRELFNQFNLGADDFYDMNTSNDNHDFNKHDYETGRVKDKDSILVYKEREDGSLYLSDILIDVGLSHHKHSSTNDLSSDRLFLNKNDDRRIIRKDFKENKITKRSTYTANDFSDNVVRVMKMVDRDDFHSQMPMENANIRLVNKYNRFHRPSIFYRSTFRRGRGW